MIKNSKFIAGVCLLAQSFTCLILALVYGKKKKGLSGTFFALSAVGGLAGAWMLYDECKNLSESKLFDLDSCDCEDEDCQCNELFGEDEEEEINFSFEDESAKEGSDEE